MGPTNFLMTFLLQFTKCQQNLKIFTSKKNTNNNWLIFLFDFNTINFNIFKNQLNANFISLIDIVGIDLTKLVNYNLFFNSDDMHCPSKHFSKLIVFNLIDYKTNARYQFFYFHTPIESVNSLETIFSNSNWLERELTEFFNIQVSNRLDTRNLLLDYNITVNPLLKIYPTEGHQEIFFNHLTFNLDYTNSEFIEL